jgi:hypothetical protein
MITLLLGMTAFAVDLGVLYNERRQDQSAVDAGALSAARLIIQGEDNQAIFEEIVERTYQNLWAPNFSLDEWYAMFDTCEDPSAAAAGYPDPLQLPSLYSSPGGTLFMSDTVECVSFDDAADPHAMRVHLPVIHVEAIFAALLGIDGWPSSAFAEVGISDPREVGGVLPFGLPSSVADDAEVCIKDGPNSPNNVCDGGDSGNYGPLDMSIFGRLSLPTDCAGSGSSADRTAANTAQGLDHFLEAAATDPPLVIVAEEPECEGDQADDPNAADTDTGFDTNAVHLGFIGNAGETKSGVSLPEDLDGRLIGIHPSLDAAYHPGSVNEVEVQDEHFVEDVPLWYFLTPTLDAGVDPDTEVPIRCMPFLFDDASNPWTQANLETALVNRTGMTSAQWGDWTDPAEGHLEYPVDFRQSEHMRNCLDDWRNGLLVPGVLPNGYPYASVLFAKDTITGDGYLDDDGTEHTVYDLEYSGRFGWVPVLWDATFPTGTKQVYFKAFQPVFFNQIFAGCKGGGSGECDFVHSPGEGLTGTKGDLASNGKIDGVSAYSIQIGMLPTELQEAQQLHLTEIPPVELTR